MRQDTLEPSRRQLSEGPRRLTSLAPADVLSPWTLPATASTGQGQYMFGFVRKTFPFSTATRPKNLWPTAVRMGL